jgi:hypothetical protein
MFPILDNFLEANMYVGKKLEEYTVCKLCNDDNVAMQISGSFLFGQFS